MRAGHCCLVGVITLFGSPVMGQEANHARKEIEPQFSEEAPKVMLLTEMSLTDRIWKSFSSENDAEAGKTWQVKMIDGEAVLICQGEPYGFLKTVRSYRDFKMGLEWRYPVDENGNSGILVYTGSRDNDEVWPTAMQVQLHQPVCGTIFCSGEATSDNEIRDVHSVCRPLNQWNSCEITSTGGALSVEMNGRKVGVVTGCNPAEGGIALQSEGSEIHFRRIWVRDFSSQDETKVPVSSAWPKRRTPKRPSRFDPNRSSRQHMRGSLRFTTFDSDNSLNGTLTYVVHRELMASDGHSVDPGGHQFLDVGATQDDTPSAWRHRLRSRRHRQLSRR